MRLIVLHPCLHRWGVKCNCLMSLSLFSCCCTAGGGNLARWLWWLLLLPFFGHRRRIAVHRSLVAFGKVVLDVACDLTEHMPRMDSSSPGSIIKRFVSEAAEKAEFNVQAYSLSKGLFIQSRRQLAILPSPGTPAKRPRRALSHEHDAEFWAPFQDHLDPSLSASLSES